MVENGGHKGRTEEGWGEILIKSSHLKMMESY